MLKQFCYPSIIYQQEQGLDIENMASFYSGPVA